MDRHQRNKWITKVCLLLLILTLFCSCSTKKGITYPPTRGSNGMLQASFAKHYTLIELVKEVDAVAHIKITSWLKEESLTSFFSAEIVNCYMGELPKTITLTQFGTSDSTCSDYPIFNPGNEFLLFLIKDTRYESEEGTYAIQNEYQTILDITEDENGKKYLLPRTSLFLHNTNDISKNQDPHLLEQLKQNLSVSDPIWNELKHPAPYAISFDYFKEWISQQVKS